MAHFAKLGLDNVVTAVLVVDTVDTMTRGGIEREEIGIANLIKNHGHENWKKCSFNTLRGVHLDGGTPFRANYPSVGWYYSSEYDIFHPPKPENCESWTLNTTTGVWDPPIPEPEIPAENIMTSYHEWDEAAYQADNTAGWVLRTRPTPTE